MNIREKLVNGHYNMTDTDRQLMKPLLRHICACGKSHELHVPAKFCAACGANIGKAIEIINLAYHDLYRSYKNGKAKKEAEFRADAIAHVGLTGHPKADKLLALAEERCDYDSDYENHDDLLCAIEDLAELLKD